MFVTRKRIVLLHLGGKVIRTTADHPFFVAGHGWTNAADLHPGDPLRSRDGQQVPVEGVSDSGEQEAVYSLTPGEHPLPDQVPPHATRWPMIGFAAGTPILTPSGPVPVEELRPGDRLLSRPDGHPPGDDDPESSQLPPWWQEN